MRSTVTDVATAPTSRRIAESPVVWFTPSPPQPERLPARERALAGRICRIVRLLASAARRYGFRHRLARDTFPTAYREGNAMPWLSRVMACLCCAAVAMLAVQALADDMSPARS